MLAEYTTALETRFRWLRFAQDYKQFSRYFHIETPLDNLRNTQAAYVDSLENADTFFINDKFGELIAHAQRTVPPDFAFDPEWLQSKSGWAWIETPVELPRINEAPNKLAPHLRAISWRLTSSGKVIVLCYSEVVGGGFAPWAYFNLEPGAKLHERIKQLETGFASTWDGEMGGTYVEDGEMEVKHEMCWAYCAFYLMAQRLAYHSNVQADRATRRRLERDQAPIAPIVRVISLRRYEEARKRAGATAEVEWSCQWEVCGHWRWQPTNDGYKHIWIDSFIKGPEDKPLKAPGLKLFAARR